MMPDFPIPDPGPFGWATLGAIVLKAIDLVLKARQVDTPEDRRTDAVLGDAAASPAEIRENPRSRSARIRWSERLAGPITEAA